MMPTTPTTPARRPRVLLATILCPFALWAGFAVVHAQPRPVQLDHIVFQCAGELQKKNFLGIYRTQRKLAFEMTATMKDRPRFGVKLLDSHFDVIMNSGSLLSAEHHFSLYRDPELGHQLTWERDEDTMITARCTVVN